MTKHENFSTPVIYLRSVVEKISVAKKQLDAFYKRTDCSLMPISKIGKNPAIDTVKTDFMEEISMNKNASNAMKIITTSCTHWSGSNINVPLRNCDIEKSNDPAYLIFYFTTTYATAVSDIIDADCNPTFNYSKVYSGVYNCANISFYVCISFGNEKISARSKFYKRFTTVIRFAAKLILSLFSPLIQTIFSSIKEMTTAEMLQVILFVALLAICLVFCMVFLIIAFQNLINNRKDKSREQGSAQRDLECHEVRTKE